MKKSTLDMESLLKNNGLKITKLRLLVLQLLYHFPAPVTAESLYKKIKNKADKASSYRTLNSFVEKGIVRKLDLVDGRASFELSVENKHFHYVVCQKCQIIEAVDFCLRNINKGALSKTKSFKKISDHQLTFSGTCKKCVRTIH